MASPNDNQMWRDEAWYFARQTFNVQGTVTGRISSDQPNWWFTDTPVRTLDNSVRYGELIQDPIESDDVIRMQAIDYGFQERTAVQVRQAERLVYMADFAQIEQRMMALIMGQLVETCFALNTAEHLGVQQSTVERVNEMLGMPGKEPRMLSPQSLTVEMVEDAARQLNYLEPDL